MLRVIKNCNDKRFDRVDSIDTLRKWISSEPICINLYTCFGNVTPIISPTHKESPDDYLSRAVAYRALDWYFLLDSAFRPKAKELLPNLTLGNALRAIAHDARERSSKMGFNNDNKKKVLIVLVIDEIQLGLGNILGSEHFDDDSARDQASRSFLRRLTGDLMQEMGHLEPFFLVPMVTGLSYSPINALINQDSMIPVCNLVPRLLTDEGMWHAVRTMYPSSFAATANSLEDLPRQFRTILAFIGGYPRGFRLWLNSVHPHLSSDSSREWSDALGSRLAQGLISAINNLPKSYSGKDTAVLKPLFWSLILAAMRNQVIDIKQPIDSAHPKLRRITWEQAMDYSGFALITQDARQRLDAPAIVLAAWLSYVTGLSNNIEALKSLLFSFTQENWDCFEEQTANYVAFLVAVPEAGTSISLATLLFPFASQDAMNGSIFSSLQVVVPAHTSYQVPTLGTAFPCSSSAANDATINKMIFKDRLVMLNAPKAPFGDSFIVLQVSNHTRTVEVLKELPFFDTKGRKLAEVIKSNEDIDLVVCIQNKHTAEGHTKLSPSEIEEEWHKKIESANESVQRFRRPFVLTMVVVSNRGGAHGTAETKQREIERYNGRASPSGTTINQAVAVKQAKSAEKRKFKAEFRALPRPYVVVVAGTTDELRDEGYTAVPMSEFFPKLLMSMIDGTGLEATQK